MGFFSSDAKLAVRKTEWEQVKNILRGKYDFTHEQVEKIEAYFVGDMNEEKKIDNGIDAFELIKALRAIDMHKNDMPSISTDKIDAFAIEMINHMKRY